MNEPQSNVRDLFERTLQTVRLEGYADLADALERLRADLPPAERRRRASLTVEVLEGTVRVDGTQVPVSDQELAVVVALAVADRGCHPEFVCDLLYPGGSFAAGYAKLRVYVHRVRRRVGYADFILSRADGYRLGANVEVDIHSIEPLLEEAILRGGVLPAGERAHLKALADRLVAPRPSRLMQWEWFVPVDERLRRLGRDVTAFLARTALECGEPQETLAIARDLHRNDPCDEEACELAIRAHLHRGDAASAAREYRRFRSTVFRELEAEPSPHLRAMLVPFPL